MWQDRAAYWEFSCRQASVVVVISTEDFWGSKACTREFEIACDDGARLCVALCVDELGRAGAEAHRRPGVRLCPQQGALADDPEAGLEELRQAVLDFVGLLANDAGGQEGLAPGAGAACWGLGESRG